MKSTSTMAFVSLVALGNAQAYTTSGCVVSPEVPFPANTVCNVRGTLGPSASKYLIESDLSGRTDVCAARCVSTPGCKFAYQENDQYVCSLYNASAPALGFRPDPSAPGVNLARNCYFIPSSCSASFQCSDGDSCAGKFLAASSDKADAAFYPTAFVPNSAQGPNKRTNFTVNTDTSRISIQQDGKRFLGAVPRTDRYDQPSVISFTSPSSAKALLSCQIAREQIATEPASFRFNCYAPGPDPETQRKGGLYSCRDAQKKRNTLRVAEFPFDQDLGGCYDKAITFETIDYVAHH